VDAGFAGSVLTITSPSEAGLVFVGVEAGDWETWFGDGKRGAAIAPVAKTITPKEPPKTEARDVAALIFDLNPRSGIISPQKVYDWDGNENDGLPDAPFIASMI
jgi:hypothetical protein